LSDSRIDPSGLWLVSLTLSYYFTKHCSVAKVVERPYLNFLLVIFLQISKKLGTYFFLSGTKFYFIGLALKDG
jgi:hypothetical protein